jgi:dihydrofolate reductase
MTIKCSVYIAVSVDGFIARPDGDIEWLHKPEYSPSAFDGLGYDDFISTVDTIVMGRNTFEKALSFGEWPYKEMPVLVLSSRPLEIPLQLEGKVRVDSGRPEDIVARLQSEGKRHLYVDGGATIQRFLQAGLIHEITITLIPVLLGGGIPLFGSSGDEVPLQLIAATSSGNGFVQIRYAVAPGA